MHTTKITDLKFYQSFNVATIIVPYVLLNIYFNFNIENPSQRDITKTYIFSNNSNSRKQSVLTKNTMQTLLYLIDCWRSEPPSHCYDDEGRTKLAH